MLCELCVSGACRVLRHPGARLYARLDAVESELLRDSAALRVAPLVRGKAKFTYAANGRLKHMAFLTVDLAFCRMRESSTILRLFYDFDCDFGFNLHEWDCSKGLRGLIILTRRRNIRAAPRVRVKVNFTVKNALC